MICKLAAGGYRLYSRKRDPRSISSGIDVRGQILVDSAWRGALAGATENYPVVLTQCLFAGRRFDRHPCEPASWSSSCRAEMDHVEGMTPGGKSDAGAI